MSPMLGPAQPSLTCPLSPLLASSEDWQVGNSVPRVLGLAKPCA